jgi:hypothetical protein
VAPPPRVYTPTSSLSGSATWQGKGRPSCIGDLEGICELCGQQTWIGKLWEGSLVCASCYDQITGYSASRVHNDNKRWEECESCGEFFPENKIVNYQGRQGYQRMCPKCARDWHRVEDEYYSEDEDKE